MFRRRPRDIPAWIAPRCAGLTGDLVEHLRIDCEVDDGVTGAEEWYICSPAAVELARQMQTEAAARMRRWA